MVLDEKNRSDKIRFDALYTLGDAIMEAFVSGKGPLGPIGLYGLWFKILVRITVVIQGGRLLGSFFFYNIGSVPGQASVNIFEALFEHARVHRGFAVWCSWLGRCLFGMTWYEDLAVTRVALIIICFQSKVTLEGAV